MVKMRVGARQTNGDPVNVLTVPREIAMFFPDVNFSVEISGCGIVYTSGAKQIITKKELREYRYEDCRLE